MSKTKAQTMTVRLPVEIGQALTKIRESNNLSTIGSALKYWIEQQTNERIDTRLNSIEEQIEKIIKILDIVAPGLTETDKLLNRILDILFKANQRFEALEKVK